MATVIRRLWHVLLAFGMLLDIAAAFVWLAGLYIISPRLADRPTGHQIISTYVGKAAINGHRWARIAEKPINLLAWLVGAGKDHCRRSVSTYGLFGYGYISEGTFASYNRVVNPD